LALMKANPTNGRYETYKLLLRKSRKPNPLHTLFGALKEKAEFSLPKLVGALCIA
jgi:hypothetical protein